MGKTEAPARPFRSVGHRLLVEAMGARVGELARLARACGVGSNLASNWKRGTCTPAPPQREVLRGLYGVPVEAWERGRTDRPRGRNKPTVDSSRVCPPGQRTGIDVGRVYDEIRKLVLTVVRQRPVPLDRDDLVQEVALTIVRRNATPSAFDPTKGSFGKYVFLCANNVIGHMLDVKRWHSREDASEDVNAIADAFEPEDETVEERMMIAEGDEPTPLWKVALDARALEKAALEAPRRPRRRAKHRSDGQRLLVDAFDGSPGETAAIAYLCGATAAMVRRWRRGASAPSAYARTALRDLFDIARSVELGRGHRARGRRRERERARPR